MIEAWDACKKAEVAPSDDLNKYVQSYGKDSTRKSFGLQNSEAARVKYFEGESGRLIVNVADVCLLADAVVKIGVRPRKGARSHRFYVDVHYSTISDLDYFAKLLKVENALIAADVLYDLRCLGEFLLGDEGATFKKYLWGIEAVDLDPFQRGRHQDAVNVEVSTKEDNMNDIMITIKGSELPKETNILEIKWDMNAPEPQGHWHNEK
jgi:hypothetical protein